jgi:hypothetical protein
MPAMTIITASVSTLVSHVITILLRRPTPSNQNAQKTLQQFLMILAQKFEGTVENIVRINSLNMQTDTFKCNLHTTINNLRLYEDQLSHLDAAAAAGIRTYSMWRSVLLPNIIRSGNHSKVYSTAAKLLMLLVATDMTLLQKCYERPGISSAQQQTYIRIANEHKAAFWDDTKKIYLTHDLFKKVTVTIDMDHAKEWDEHVLLLSRGFKRVEKGHLSAEVAAHFKCPRVVDRIVKPVEIVKIVNRKGGYGNRACQLFNRSKDSVCREFFPVLYDKEVERFHGHDLPDHFIRNMSLLIETSCERQAQIKNLADNEKDSNHIRQDMFYSSRQEHGLSTGITREFPTYGIFSDWDWSKHEQTWQEWEHKPMTECCTM